MDVWLLLVSSSLLSLVIADGKSRTSVNYQLSEQGGHFQGTRDHKCGYKPLQKTTNRPLEFMMRIVGGKNSEVGGQPWTVSLQMYGKHLCGGSIVEKGMVVTAAHCVYPADRTKVSQMVVIAGDYDQNVIDPQEQSIPLSDVAIHPKYKDDGSMSYDIALLFLSRNITFGSHVQPICLPQEGEKVEPGTLCISSGWGTVNEYLEMPAILQEVQLPIIDNITCSSVLESMGLPTLHETMLCAGFPDGGKDACQGDSGGPLACRRRTGSWFLAGCSSWGLGCGRPWSGSKSSQDDRGSPAIFSKVSVLLDFLRSSNTDGNCNSKVLRFRGDSGIIKYPTNTNYSDNSLCEWKITTEENMIMQIKLVQLDIEYHATCIYDYLSFAVKEKTIRKICGSIAPSPLLIPSNHLSIIFFSDMSINGYGFELHYSTLPTITTTAASGCDSIAVLHEEGKIYTASYPNSYPSHTTCHWIIEAPKGNIVKLFFEDFAMEFHKDCVYDRLSIYDDGSESNLLESALSELAGNSTITVNVPAPRFVAQDVCGIAPLDPQWVLPRIVGGEQSCPNCWPWQVGILFLGVFQCGGVIISPHAVLSAAHCIQSFDPSHLLVVAGKHDWLLKEPSEQKRAVQMVYIHEYFELATYDYDMAVVWFAESLVFNDYVRPVCMPHVTEPLIPSLVCVVTGWGNTEEDGQLSNRLKQLQVPILDIDVCNKTYYPGLLTERMVCAGFPTSRHRDSCQGDSGGPLFCPRENTGYVLYGIVSWGVGCARFMKPGIYSRVLQFNSWIQAILQDQANQINNQTKPRTRTVEIENDQAKSSGCKSEEVLRGSVGSIASPGFPYGYAEGINCSWVIRISPTGVSKIVLEKLSIEESSDCVSESLSIYEEDGKSRKLLTQRCGFVTSQEVYESKGPVIRITFQTNSRGSNGKTGFAISYRKYGGQVLKPFQRSLNHIGFSVPKVCTDDILTSNNGAISSPGYPSNYPNDLRCHWRIIAPLGNLIRINLLDLKTEQDASGCMDELVIYDGTGHKKNVLGSYCGQINHYSLKSNGPEITLTFTTNSNVTMTGFNLEYYFWVPQQNFSACKTLDLLQAGSSEIKSPHYPGTYPDGLDCQWIIFSTSGTQLKLLINDLFLEDSTNCTWDYLNVFDGPNNESPLLVSLCGYRTGLTLESSASFLTLHFHSDKSIGNRGFSVHYGEVTESPVQTSRMLESTCNTGYISSEFVDPFLMGKSNIRANATNNEWKFRVIGGQPAPSKSWPWIVSLQTKRRQHYCGGTILNEKWILTAAHCNFRVGTDKVFVGKTDLSLEDGLEVFVIETYTHPLHDPDVLPPSNDLTLLELNPPLLLGHAVACASLQLKAVLANASCMTAGWGAIKARNYKLPNVLQHAMLPLVPFESCRGFWGSDINDKNVCAGGMGATSCVGDSGGPLICKVKSQYLLVGVVSWGSDECDLKAPAVYTNVSSYSDWLSDYIDF
uniref:Ovochymase-2 n=1 Tax=Leptobrachium leishanense TaxID=445787 RepID=A0A8C5MW66_9ANUR